MLAAVLRPHGDFDAAASRGPAQPDARPRAARAPRHHHRFDAAIVQLGLAPLQRRRGILWSGELRAERAQDAHQALLRHHAPPFEGVAVPQLHAERTRQTSQRRAGRTDRLWRRRLHEGPERRGRAGTGQRTSIVPAVKILFVVSEVAPFSKTGGLADVAAALPSAMVALGHDVLVVSPRYRGVDPNAAPDDGVERLFVERPDLFDRAGIYGERGVDYPDNDVRFAALCDGALAGARSRGFDPDVVHLHDWQTGLAAVRLRRRRRRAPTAKHPATVFTIHNLALPGALRRRHPAQAPPARRGLHPGGIEFHGRVSFLKAGLVFADAVTTVSPRYAREIQTTGVRPRSRRGASSAGRTGASCSAS